MKTVRSIEDVSKVCPTLAADIQASYDEMMKVYIEDDGSILNRVFRGFAPKLEAEGMIYY